MSVPATHICKFRSARKESSWHETGALREREIERVSLCVECGKERSGRFRKIVALERESVSVGVQPDVLIRRLARKLDAMFQTRDFIRAEPLIRRLGGAGGEAEIERLALHGGIRLIYQRHGGTLHLKAIRVLDRSVLAETAEPGAAQRRKIALEEARRLVQGMQHPQAQAVAEHFFEERAEFLDYQTVRALAALAQLVEDGEAVPARVFSARVLGHSKILAALRPRLERMVGPLERLGIRDFGQAVMLGGKGILRFPDHELDLRRFHHLGIAVRDALIIEGIEFPTGGLLVVENLTPFQTCVDLLADKKQLLVLWSAGFPGRGVLAVIRKAANCGARIRVWCDLDLGGVRIARTMARVAGNLESVLMDSSTVASSETILPLSPEQVAALRRELTRYPADPWSDTLRAILARGGWIEQEMLLDRMESTID
jgi:Wadjet protein JetD, C-terminal